MAKKGMPSRAEIKGPHIVEAVRARPGRPPGAPKGKGGVVCGRAANLRRERRARWLLYKGPMKRSQVETILRRLSELFAASALAACAVGVESTPPLSQEDQPLGASPMALSISGEIPKCKDDEVLCCPNGGPRCSCLPAGHTCSSGFVVSPALERAP
jgi:hypothetical protein